MKKKYKVSLIAFIAAFLSAALLAVCLLTARPAAVYASDRYVTVDGSNVFYAAIRGASVTSGKETTKDADGNDADHYYTVFKIGENETVSYRKSLAYEWMTGDPDEDGDPTSAPVTCHFSMTIGFDSFNFKRYIIAFQSQQYMKTDDKITENFLVFAPADGGKVSIAAVQSLDELDEDGFLYPVSCTAENNARIKISFGECRQGTVAVGIEAEDTGVGDLNFKNVYYPYASYVSSGDNAVTPLVFSAEFDDSAQPAEGQDELTADMKLYELNGQSFELYAHDSDGVYDDVKDNAPPVICFEKTPSYVEFGKTIDFDFKVIDVLASSPRQTPYFYVLTGEQYGADDFNYAQIKYEDESDGEEEGEGNKKHKNPFIAVNSGSDIRVIRDANTFVPARYLDSTEDFTVYGLIKIYFEISDVSGSTAQTDKVFVDWYAKREALVNIYSQGFKDGAGKTEEEIAAGNFLKIIDGKNGVSYAKNTDDTLKAYEETISAIQQEYQAKIDDAIKALDDQKLYAGGDSNFYLPALEGLIKEVLEGDEYLALQDFKYSLYYRAKSTGSNTSLDYNKLSVPLKEADVTYRFTVFVTDAFGNPMRYPDVDDGGNKIWKEITTDDIWDEDFAQLLPFFEINVSYKKATAENPEKLSVAYVGTSYSGVSFNIKDGSSTASTKYNLYIFDRNAAYSEIGLDLTYAEFVDNFEALFANKYDGYENTRKYFTTVKPANQLQSSDENYDLFKAINWNASSVSFTPQSAEDFYIVRLTLTDNRSQTSEAYFATVAASIQTKSLKGEDDWLENNIASVVLLCVAGVLFIAFIVLLVVKPKDKGDIDEIYENDKKGKKSKKSK